MKKLFIFILLLVLIAGGIYYFRKKNNKVEYYEINPEHGSISIEFRTTGAVSPRNRLEIMPPITGRIERINVKEGQNVKKGEIIAYISSMERAAMLDAARSKGESELKKWEDIYKQTPVIAPLDGFIIAKDKESGQTISSSDPILVMADKLIIEANVDETDLSHIFIGQRVKIYLDAYPDKKFKGIVEHIAYESQLISNVTVYQVKIRPIDVPNNFRAGMTATIEIESDKKENVLLVPFDTVTFKQNKKTILIKKDGQPVEQQIETGINNGKKIEIISGLRENDVILVKKSTKNRKNQTLGGMPGVPGGRH